MRDVNGGQSHGHMAVTRPGDDCGGEGLSSGDGQWRTKVKDAMAVRCIRERVCGEWWSARP